jgi:hypothetical protein
VKKKPKRGPYIGLETTCSPVGGWAPIASFGVDCFVTDYGTVTAGPLFRSVIDELKPDLQAKTRSKKYKQARHEMDKLEACVNTLHRVFWRADIDLLKTP